MHLLCDCRSVTEEDWMTEDDDMDFISKNAVKFL